MVLDSLREGWAMIRRFPSLFLIGLAAGMLGFATLLIQVLAGAFFAERFTVLVLLVLPFFVGGVLQIVHKTEGSLSVLLEGGKKYYFRILLASLVIVFAALLTMVALVVPLTLLGFGVDAGVLPFTLLGVFVPLVYFTLFYDTAVVFEDRKVLDSLRRSVEFVTNRGFSVFLFLVVNLLILAGITFALLIVWSIVLSPQLEPLAMNVTLGEPIPTEAIIAALGPTGMIITGLFYLVGITISVTIFYTYKACYFRKYVSEVAPVPGEFDEKGRWYKY
ncbi:MAG: hypothetical protein LUO93_08225 [Methanomicrobiales archaeon]|nr:hypothetical protein [Methanomicrobiales archaeon]